MSSIRLAAFCVFASCLLMIAGFACDSSENYVGTYRAIDITSAERTENTIELLENGEGAWGCCDGEVLFTWYVKKNELRINTKEGGIMVGEIKKNAFTITLPGEKTLTFVKIPSPDDAF